MIRFAAIAAIFLGGCAGVLGIQDLGVEPSPTEPEVEPSVSDANHDVVIPEAGSPPADVDAGLAQKRVFVTQKTMKGALGGPTGADSTCATAAKTAALDGGPWVAWLGSGGSSAIGRIQGAGPWFLLDHRRVADKAQLITGTLDVRIDVMENGLSAPQPTLVWTGANADGTAAEDCQQWTSADPNFQFGVAGNLNQLDGNWTRNGGQNPPFLQTWNCGFGARLYCFEL